MKTVMMLFLVLISLGGVGTHFALRSEPERASPGSQKTGRAYCPDGVAATGIVEGATPEIALRAETTGLIARVYHRENEEVAKGTVLVELNNDAQKQQVAVAEAEVAAARAELDRLVNGERPEKRKALAAVETAQRATYELAEANWNRSRELASSKSISREEVDHKFFAMTRAFAELKQTQAERALVDAPAREDEVRAATARVKAAEGRLGLARAELAKTRLLAPSSGRILHLRAEPGEMAGPASPQPILVMADLSKRRVRAFVEELDAARVQVGQHAAVTVDGLPGQEFVGKVGLVLSRMGKRAPETNAPGEYRDVYYREVLIDLEQAYSLPVNLRVRVRIR